MNLMEFERQFSSEEACLQYLSTLRFYRRKSYFAENCFSAWFSYESLMLLYLEMIFVGVNPFS